MAHVTSSTASTNSASLASKAIEPVNSVDADDEEEAAPTVDAALEEAEKILVDYIRLLSHKGLASSTR
jgi:hypothetical protein